MVLSPPLWAATTAENAGALVLLFLELMGFQGGPGAMDVAELSLKAFLAGEQETSWGVPAGRLLPQIWAS